MKQITIAGNIGKDAELRSTQSGDYVAGFSVAVEARENGQKATEWFDVSIWGKRAQALSQYLTKGTRVCVTGDLGKREYNGKTYLTVKADQITIMGGGNRDQQGGYRKPASSAHAGGYGGPGASNDMDDEIAF